MPARFAVPYRVRVQLLRRYRNGESIRQIAKSIGGVKQETIARLFRRHGVEVRNRNEKVLTLEQENRAIQLYERGRSNLDVLGKRYGMTGATIKKMLERRGVVLRPVGGIVRHFTKDQETEIARRYKDGFSQAELAKEFGGSQIRISRLLRRKGIHCGPKAFRHHHGMWSGGRTVAAGYFAVMPPENSPYKAMRTSTGYILEHRYVMAQKIGRCLTKSETVHHINGDRMDNRPENLELRQGRHGRGIALMCADCGSRHIVPAPLASVTAD